MEKLTYSVPEFAEVMGISKSLAYFLVNKGTIPVIRFNTRKLISKSTVDRILSGEIKIEGGGF